MTTFFLLCVVSNFLMVREIPLSNQKYKQEISNKETECVTFIYLNLVTCSSSYFLVNGLFSTFSQNGIK